MEDTNQPVDSAPDIDIDTKINAKVDEALTKIQNEYQDRLKEQERLSKLSDDERQKAELENTRAELAAKEQELKRKELELEITKVLNQRGIPLAFKNYFVAEDNKTMLDQIKAFEKEYKAAIEAGVNEKLKGKAPPASNATDNTGKSFSRGFIDAIRKNQILR